jgi:hypothetical protein
VRCEVQKVNERDVTFCESTKTICGGAGIRNEEGRGDTDTSWFLAAPSPEWSGGKYTSKHVAL